jgi:hypothetical protein
MEKYGTTKRATDYKVIRRMGIARWIPKAKGTSSEYVIQLSHSNNG